MSKKKKGKGKLLLERFKTKFRLVILNDDTFEEKLSFRLSRLNVFLVVSAGAILLVFITTYIIAFTPLKVYIPGYASDVNMRSELINLNMRADSIAQEIKAKEIYLGNLKSVLQGESPKENNTPIKPNNINDYSSVKNSHSKEDSILRSEFENVDKYNLALASEAQQINSISNYLFFAPIKGVVSRGYNPRDRHYGIDITAAKDEAIKATLDGTIVFADWTLETGYVICIQHTGNLISTYKHNSALLKKAGSFVKAGEPIAIIGNSGEKTSGMHLHLELWYNGNPLNPKDYISF